VAFVSIWTAQPFGIEYFVRNQEIFQDAPAYDGFFDDSRDVIRLHAAIPNLLRIDHNRWAAFTLIETTRFVCTHLWGELLSFDFDLKQVAELLRSVGITAAAAMARLALVATDENVAGKF